VRLRRLVLVPVVAALGAGVVVLPALAASEGATVKVVEPTACSYDWGPSYPCWGPERTTIASGATVKFVNESSTIEQLVKWTGVPAAPTCENVPTAAPQKGPWQGTCTFPEPGTYHFEGARLYSSGTIVVNASSTGTTTTGTPTSSTLTGSTPTGTSTSGSPMPTGSPNGSPSPLGSLFVGTATTALKLPTTQHGRSVHGSVNVSEAGAGGSLEVELLATRASLAGAGHVARVQVGKVLRNSLQAGTATFTVPLDARARRALRTHGHLELTVQLVLSSAQGSTATLTRRVLIRS
jgi:plastocyanin